MARGHQKIQAQQKNQEKKKQDAKKSAGDTRKTASAGLVFSCSVCRTQMGDPKTYKMHFESKHPKNDLPAELKDI